MLLRLLGIGVLSRLHGVAQEAYPLVHIQWQALLGHAGTPLETLDGFSLGN